MPLYMLTEKNALLSLQKRAVDCCEAICKAVIKGQDEWKIGRAQIFLKVRNTHKIPTLFVLLLLLRHKMLLLSIRGKLHQLELLKCNQYKEADIIFSLLVYAVNYYSGVVALIWKTPILELYGV